MTRGSVLGAKCDARCAKCRTRDARNVVTRQQNARACRTTNRGLAYSRRATRPTPMAPPSAANVLDHNRLAELAVHRRREQSARGRPTRGPSGAERCRVTGRIANDHAHWPRRVAPWLPDGGPGRGPALDGGCDRQANGARSRGDRACATTSLSLMTSQYQPGPFSMIRYSMDWGMVALPLQAGARPVSPPPMPDQVPQSVMNTVCAQSERIAIAGRASELINRIGPVGDQAANGDKVSERVDRGNRCRRELSDQIAMNRRRRARGHDQASVRVARECRDVTLNLAGDAHANRAYLHAERRPHGLDRPQLAEP